MLKIDYHTFNNLILREDSMHIMDYNIEDKMFKRCGIVHLEPYTERFQYGIEFVSDNHQSLFLLNYGHIL